MGNYQNSRSTIMLPIYLAATLCIGVFLGTQMSGSKMISSSSFMQSLSKFRQVLTYIESDYVEEVSSDVMVEQAIESMLKTLDPHTTYIPAKELSLIQSQLDGNYEGIGIEFNIFRDTIQVVSPLSGGPSEKLGIKAGDKIVHVDGQSATGPQITNQKVVEMLRGPGGSEVRVHIVRKGEDQLLEFNIKRDVIPQYSVDVSYMVEEEIGYIKIARFANATYREYKEALADLNKKGMTKLILDLTGNPGGYLNRAVQIVDELLAGDALIVYTDGKLQNTEKHYASKEGIFEEGQLVVLVDEGSASASEIVAGAIQDHDRGLIVGRRTFGKGLVQAPLRLNDGSELRLTISRYYTPSGRSIQKTYAQGVEEYHKEAYARLVTGELYTSDSIKVNDSLAFYTDGGRLVYGGGGIMPDYFVPLDTTQGSTYLNRLFSTNTVQEYTLTYAQKNQSSLKEMGLDEFKESFQIDEQMLSDVIQLAAQNQLPYDAAGFERSKRQIMLLTKAYIARSIWNNEGFYPIYNQQNEILQKAVLLLKEQEKIIP